MFLVPSGNRYQNSQITPAVIRSAYTCERNFAGRRQTTKIGMKNEALDFGHSIGSGLDVVCRASANDVCMRDAH
jgi:hypothetical protein